MKKPSYRPMRAREISKRLGVPKESRSVFKKVLKKLVREGAVERIKGGRYKLPGEGLEEHKDGRKVETTRQPKAASPAYKIPKNGKVLGKFVRTGKTGVILPRNRKIPPLLVRLSDVKGLRNESLVVAEVAGYAKRRRSSTGFTRGRLQGTVIDVLGKAGSLDVERKSILIQYDLTEEFPPGVLREVERMPSGVLHTDLMGREDLRSNLIFTIDNDRAKDFDDAVGISRTHSGYKLWVSIADVSHYVKLGSAIDNETLTRATSVYLPEKVIPMLPEKLSNWICSLVPNEDRLTKTVEMDFDRKGLMTDFRIYNSVIKSRHRLTYTGVSEMLENRGNRKKGSELVESLEIMKELYEKLRERRIERGGLDFDISEPELIRDELGSTIDVIKSERNVANGIIEEFMIAANSAVAEYIFHSRSCSIYRIHEPPDMGSIKELAGVLKKMGYILHIDGKLKGLDIQRVISKSKDEPDQIAVSMLILRALKRALYSTVIEGHFGLALDHYTHFTSPIRRYLDLVVHRIVGSLIKGRRSPYSEESLDWIASHSSVKERFAVEVEREAVELERVYMMKSHIGKEFEGFVVGVLPFGIFVELKEIFVEGFVPKELIKMRRGKRYEIGEEVEVRVIEADVEKRRITLEKIS
ncbi:MAG TPA: VacB/RNase II family 3'-5' exoribonuclease [Thermodesulfobacteriota bacterium]|nr:VacB/RNase II family 3'-5' exoribonuclease [Thermodesulfobacteriota bacterium]